LLFKGVDSFEDGAEVFYQDFLIASTKGAQLIIDTFDEVSQIIRTGDFTFSSV